MHPIFLFIIVVACVVIFYNYYERVSQRKKIYVRPELLSELKDLHDKLVNEGCKDFYIHGVNEQSFIEGYCLELRNDEWLVFYSERGGEYSPKFFYEDKEGAFNYFYEFILNKEHLHLIAFTRSLDICTYYKNELNKHGVTTIQDDIPNYNTPNDHVYRLLVKNKGIFKAKKILDKIPFFDEDLK